MRIYNSHNVFFDFCLACRPEPEEAEEEYNSMPLSTPENRYAYDAEHPSYAGENYCCAWCNKQLTARDDT